MKIHILWPPNGEKSANRQWKFPALSQYDVRVSIRVKILIIVFPLLLVSVILVSQSSSLLAEQAVTQAATVFLDFKAGQLEKYAESQWNILVENSDPSNESLLAATKAAVESSAQSMIQTSTELVFAVDETGQVVMRTSAVNPDDAERAKLAELYASGQKIFDSLVIGGKERTFSGFGFAPFGWYVLVSEENDTFYAKVNQITQQNWIILIISIIVSLALLFFIVAFITRPLKNVVGAMRKIIEESDLSERVAIEYSDEIGQLSHTFNIMLGELEKAYNQIKKYAFDAVLAQKKEAKIRNIFQKYVPQQLIDRFFQNPEGMLVGENRNLAILFSDIRSFTTISEAMRPDELVTALNRYFTQMVDIIYGHEGIVDKYIGDAIMAFFGAPVKGENDALNALRTALDMVDALDAFNKAHEAAGKPAFKTGLGINYGEVTVGNIGSDRKMDYTVIGDSVNLASRLEGLSKPYHQPIIISEFVEAEVRGVIPCRLLDRVAVKGKTRGVEIYTARRELTPVEAKAWPIHAEAMKLYFAQDFKKAKQAFNEVTALLGKDDFASTSMTESCDAYLAAPPPENWDGVTILKEK